MTRCVRMCAPAAMSWDGSGVCWGLGGEGYLGVAYRNADSGFRFLEVLHCGVWHCTHTHLVSLKSPLVSVACVCIVGAAMLLCQVWLKALSAPEQHGYCFCSASHAKCVLLMPRLQGSIYTRGWYTGNVCGHSPSTPAAAWPPTPTPHCHNREQAAKKQSSPLKWRFVGGGSSGGGAKQTPSSPSSPKPVPAAPVFATAAPAGSGAAAGPGSAAAAAAGLGPSSLTSGSAAAAGAVAPSGTCSMGGTAAPASAGGHQGRMGASSSGAGGSGGEVGPMTAARRPLPCRAHSGAGSRGVSQDDEATAQVGWLGWVMPQLVWVGGDRQTEAQQGLNHRPCCMPAGSHQCCLCEEYEAAKHLHTVPRLP